MAASAVPSLPRPWFRHLGYRYFSGAAALIFSAVFFVSSAPQSVHAATYYWDSNDSTAGFGTAQGTWAAPTTNDATQGWSTSSAGTSAMSGNTTTATSDTLWFGTASDQLGTGTVTISGNVSANYINFRSTSSNISLSGGNITLQGYISAINSGNTTAITDTISSNITLNATQNWTVSNGGSVGTANLDISGNVRGGSYSLAKFGNGTLTLSGAANSWNGTTTIDTGTLTLSGTLSTTGQIRTTSTATSTTFNITGNLTQTRAADVRNFVIAGASNRYGTVNVSGSAIVNLAAMFIGEEGGGYGVLNQSGGTVNTGGNVWLAGQASTLNVSGGHFNVGTSNLSLGMGTSANSNSTLTVNGTGRITAGTLHMGQFSRNATAMTLNLGDGTTGGNLTINSISYGAGASAGPTTINFNGGTLTANANFSMITQATTVVKSGGAIINVVPSRTFTIGTALTDGGGGGGLTKDGSGTLNLSGVNTYTGMTTINSGTLRLGGAASADTITGDITINTGGTLNYSSANDNQIKNTSNVTIAGGTFDVAARTETISSLTMTSGSLVKGGGSFTATTGPATLSGGTVTLATGTISLGTNSQFTGTEVTLTSGTLNVGSNATFQGSNATFSATSSRLNTTDNFNIGNSTFSYNNASASTTGLTLSGNIEVQAGATTNFKNDAAGAGRINLNGENRTIDVGSGANMNVDWVVANSSGTRGIIKEGVGTLTLNATNTYTGTTIINAGTLVLNGTNTSSAITINSGTLAGTGSGGDTTVESGGRISPGGSSIGTLATSTLTLNGGGGYTFHIDNVSGTPGTNWDLLNVGGGSGLVTINSSGGTPFTIYLNGSPTGWSDSATYSWNIISSSNISGFAADKFAFNLAGFNGGVAPTGSFYMTNSGTALVLNYGILGESIWSGGTGSWDTGFSPALTNNTNVVFTGAGGTATNNMTTATLDSLQSITFNSTAGSYTLTADSGSAGHSATQLTVSGSIINNSTADQTVNLAMTFNTNRVVDTASGNISIGGVINGSGGLTKNGSSTLTLTDANTLTGPIQVNEGTLATTGSGGFANTANITVASGATYNVGVADQINSLTSPGSLTLANGTLTISSSTTNSSISGAITGSGGLTKNGSSSLTISNNNSGYSGTTTIGAGTLLIGNDGALGSGNLQLGQSGVTATITIASTDSTARTISNELSNLAGSTFNLTLGQSSGGTGNLTFSGTGSTTLGATRTFTVLNTSTFDGVFAGTSSSALTKSGTGTMILTGNSTYGGTTTINAGTLQIGAGGGTGSIDSPTIVNNSALLVNRTGSLTLSGNMSGTGILTKNGSGTLVLTGNNTYGGTTTINAGTLEIGASGQLGGGSYAGNIVMNGAFTYNSTADQTLSGQLSGVGNLNKYGSGTLTLSGSNTRLGNLNMGLNSPSLTGGTVKLAHNNAIGSGSIIWENDGIIELGVDGLTIGNNNLINNRGSATDGRRLYRLDLAGSNTGTLSGGFDIRNFSSTTTFDVGTDDTLTLSGNILNASNAGAFTKTGDGTLVLTGAANTASGTIVISAGTLQIGNGGTTGTLSTFASGNAVTNNGTLVFNRSDAITVANAISGTGALVKQGASTLTLSGSNSYSGGTTLNSGTLVIGNTAAAANGTITQTDGTSLLKLDTTGTIANDMSIYNVASNKTVTLTGAIIAQNTTYDVADGTTLSLNGTISGSGGVTKNGSGTLVLSGNNTYSAPTVINSGTLEAASAGALGSNNTVDVNGGTLLVSANGSLTGKNIDIGGSGVGLQFSGNYIGAVGALTLSADSSIDLGTGSVQILFQGLTLSGHTLSFYNWTGLTHSEGGTGADQDKVFLLPAIEPGDLNKISFYSGDYGTDSFLGTGFDLGLEATDFTPALGNQIIPVPEPETYATGLLLLLGGSWWMWRRQKTA
jgi:autotransporter-associated beta strand protein